MTDPYDQIVTLGRMAFDTLKGDEKRWIGLAGAPGSGKSTVAEMVQQRLPEMITVIPMDGYHYYRSELDDMDDPQEAHARRGAPFTFNARRFVDELRAAKERGAGLFPSFNHSVGDPVENDIELQTGKQVVIIEGNYLLLESPPWASLKHHILDETWFLDVPLDVCCSRVEKRHIDNGLTREEAQRRVTLNDGPNAQLVREVSLRNADLTFRM